MNHVVTKQEYDRHEWGGCGCFTPNEQLELFEAQPWVWELEKGAAK